MSQYEINARTAKVAAFVDAIGRHAGIDFDAADAAIWGLLANAWEKAPPKRWDDLAARAGLKPLSATSKALVVGHLRNRPAAITDDPFAGLPGGA